MKLNKVFAALMAVVTLVAFSACNKESQDVIKLKLNKANLTVGQTYTVPVEKASGDITWTSSNEAVATVDAQGTITAVAEGSSAVKATVGKASATVDVTVTAGGQTGGAPDLDAPAEGKLLVVIEIPEGTECNGIALKGTFGEPNETGDGYLWSGEDTYLGEDGAQTPVAGKIYKFEAIKDYANWYKVEIPMTEALEFKVCLIYAKDGSWEGQATDVALHSCNYSSVAPTIDGGQCKEFNATTGLLYLSIGGWNKSECVEEVLVDRKVTVIVPECGFEIPSVVGSFNGWDATAIPMTLVENYTYTATVQAYASDKFKIAGSVSGWDNQPLFYDAENDGYVGMNDTPFGNDTEFTLDFSAGKWMLCSDGGEE
ncbi:MAG: Ig-like domain-containing protein [Paludibacteraceae bacterium]|nr:Ig-like domain-containing protein [Paludibacteraceae bacterium]